MDMFTGAFLAGLAADLTGRVLKAGGAKVREVISGTEEEKALERCIWAGVVALVARASIDEPVKTRKLEKLFEKFFSASFVAWELSKLLKGRELDKEVLTDLFEQAGYSAEILPGLDIATGIDLFEAAFAEAAEREPALQGRIQAGNLREQTHLQRDMRAGIQEMVSLLRNAEPGSIAISQGQIVIENVGQISIFQQAVAPVAEKDQSEPLRTAYLNHLFETVGRLSLTGIDPKAASDAEARLDLGAVYTALLTLTPEECQRVKDRGCVESEMREVRRLSALEHLNEKHRLVLLGDPGSGKSTFINFVALCLAGESLGRPEANLTLLTDPLPQEDEHRHRDETPKRQPWSHGALLPVRIVLRDFAARGLPPGGESATAQHLWDFIAGELKSAALADYAEHLRRYLMEKGGIILLDGLDEVPEAEHRREQIKDVVEDFVAVFHKCRFLITSRTYAYQQQAWRLVDFSETVLAPFGGGQIRRFVDRWYAHIAQLRGLNRDDALGGAELLKRAIFGSDRLRALAERPLLLTLMASLHAWRGGTLPEKREQLYADTVDLLLDWWERPKVVKDRDGKAKVLQPSLTEWLKLDRTKVRGLLNELAYRAHAEQPDTVGTADIPEDWLISGLLDLSESQEVRPKLLVEFLSERAGLLLPRGVKVYAFPHRTIQEYLAACYLTDHDYPAKVAEYGRTDPDRWREVALLAGAKSARGSDFALWALVERLCFRDLAPDEALDEPGSWGALLAGQALVESAKLETISKPDLSKIDRVRTHLVRIIEAGRLPATERVAAGNNLAQLGDPREAVTTVDKMGFCLVPAGPFWMGGEEYDIEKPMHLNEHLDYDYWMARYPVTVVQFHEFVELGGYKPDSRINLRGMANHPAVDVSWHDARRFCEWLTERWRRSGMLEKEWKVFLPTEAQWEKAARGGVQVPEKWAVSHMGPEAAEPRIIKNSMPKREYPWGVEPNPDLANYHDTRIGSTSAVGCFRGGASPYGCLDMSGNVWEWTRSLWGKDFRVPEFKYPYDPNDGREKDEARDEMRRVVRGGSFGYLQWFVRCACRYRFHPYFRSWGIGFRVVVSPS